MQNRVSCPDPSCMAGEEQPGTVGRRDTVLSPVRAQNMGSQPCHPGAGGCGQSALSANVRCCLAGKDVDELLSMEETFPFLSLPTFIIIQAVVPMHLLGRFITCAAESILITHTQTLKYPKGGGKLLISFIVLLSEFV